MATRTKTETAVIPGSADQLETIDEGDEDSPFDRLVAAFGALGEGEKPPKIGLYQEVHVDPTQPYHVQQQQQANVGKFQFLRTYSPEELDGNDLDMIRSQFGPGKYELRLYGYKPGSTRYTVIAKPQILIGALPGMSQAQVQHQAPQIAPQSDVTAVLGMIAKGQEQLLAALTQRPDPMSNMKDMLTMMTMMREAMGINNQQQQQKSSIVEIVEAIKELKGVSELINPQKDEEESPEEKMMKMAQPLIGLATAAFQKAPAQVAPVAVPTAFQEQPAISHQAPVEQETQGEDQMKAELEANLKTLLEMAEKKAPIEEGAEFLYERLPDEFVNLLNMEMWWEGLSTHIPAVKPHEEWIKKVRDRLLEIFKEEAQDTSPPLPNSD
jgi:hypothetical protein